MSRNDCVLFTAGHGFYHFAISRDVFDRSLYYNLLLQPQLGVPDHYFLQGEWIGAHLGEYPARDSWLEVGLRNNFVVPFFRLEGRGLPEILAEMLKGDRRGFSDHAKEIADRLSRTPSVPRHWSSKSNSKMFGETLSHYATAPDPPMLEMGFGLDPDDFCGFWARSREWIAEELARGYERSTARLGTNGLLLSQMIQVSGERILGDKCGEIRSVSQLLSRAKSERGLEAYSDLRTYYTMVSELYNRSLADTLFTAPNSPRWQYYVAALDVWREQLEQFRENEPSSPNHVENIDVVIRLPKVAHLRRVSGDTFLSIRKSAACERFFESMASWRAEPNSATLREELVDTLHRYSDLIVKQVGDSVGFIGLRPHFVSRVSDIMRLGERVPQLVHGVLAVAGMSVLTNGLPLSGQVSLFGLAGVLTAAKLVTPSERVTGTISPSRGPRFCGDVSINRT